MRGGTKQKASSSGTATAGARPGRDNLLLRLMGSPDPDAAGRSWRLALQYQQGDWRLSASERADCDVEYLFAQVGIDRAQWTTRHCGEPDHRRWALRD